MSDFISQARNARTHLMQALGVLQLDEVPPQLQAVAEGVAQVMSLLHRIETKGEQAPTANQALVQLRAVLNHLQAPENEHPTAEAALEVVAGALGMVHQLAKGLEGAAKSPAGPAPAPVPTNPLAQTAGPRPVAPQVSPPATNSSAATQPKPPAVLAPTPVDPAPAAPTPAPLPPTTRNGADIALGNAATQAVMPERSARQVPMLPPEPDYATAPSLPDAGQPPTAAVEEDPIPLSRVSSPPTMPSAPPSPFAAPAAAAIEQPPRAPSHNPEPQRISSNPGSLPPLPALPGEVFVEAALGAYSTTNFFKGLSGNDVIDAGGLFVATYAPPDLGQKLRVHVSLPGGFEFQARGTVTWVREMPKTGSLNPLSPPGYGVKFTEISKEARQLVYRYVRNREPLFHDDL